MATNIFGRVIDYLNKPFPGAPTRGQKPDGKSAPAPKPAPPSTTRPEQQRAPDLQAQLRKRDLELRRARARADVQQRATLDRERRELEELRRKYEQEMATEATKHADRSEWTHTVAPGDSLSRIARRYYGNANRWPEIFEANKGQIKNPNLIYPGQVLVIPDKE